MTDCRRLGTLYGVGVGPGDPELLTLKAVRVLEACPVVAAPCTRGGESLALAIAGQAVDLSAKTVLRLPFAMERAEDARQPLYAEAAAVVVDHLEAGRNVAFAVLGDVSVYATFGYVAEPVAARGYAVEAVPGVPSFCAVAARLGESLTVMDEPLHLVPAGAMAVEEALGLPGTKVLMKAGSRLPQVVEALDGAGALAASTLVANCGLANELVARGEGLRTVERDAGYFATVVVRGARWAGMRGNEQTQGGLRGRLGDFKSIVIDLAPLFSDLRPSVAASEGCAERVPAPWNAVRHPANSQTSLTFVLPAIRIF